MVPFDDWAHELLESSPTSRRHPTDCDYQVANSGLEKAAGRSGGDFLETGRWEDRM
jgi:hypothetical protein